MRSLLALMFCAVLLARAGAATPERPLKVFISVDMEGLSGVVTEDQVSASGKDYVNAAAGAEIEHGFSGFQFC